MFFSMVSSLKKSSFEPLCFCWKHNTSLVKFILFTISPSDNQHHASQILGYLDWAIFYIARLDTRIIYIYLTNLTRDPFFVQMFFWVLIPLVWQFWLFTQNICYCICFLWMMLYNEIIILEDISPISLLKFTILPHISLKNITIY